MNNEPGQHAREVVEELLLLARRSGWDAAAEAVREALDGELDRELGLLLTGAPQETALAAWLGARTRGDVDTLAAAEALRAPLAAFKCARLVVMHECGAPLPPELCDVLQTLFFPRPAGSYAIVLFGAGRLGGPEELERVEDAARRTLTAGGDLAGAATPLHEAGVFLWGDEAAPSGAEQQATSNTQQTTNSIAERLTADRERLAAWALRPLERADLLEWNAAAELLGLAEREAAGRGAPEAAAPDPAELERSREQLAQTRERLMRRLRDDADSIRRNLVTMLRSEEQRLAGQLGPALEQAQRAGRLASDRDFAELLNGLTREALARWAQRTTQWLDERAREVAADTRGLLAGQDWALVQQAAELCGMGIDDPQAMARARAYVAPATAHWLPAEAGSPAGPLPRAVPWVPVSLMALGGMAAGAVAGYTLLHRWKWLAATLHVRKTAAAVALGGLAGGAGGGVLGYQNLTRQGALESAARLAGEFVRHAFEDVQARVNAQSADLLKAYREHLAQEFTVLESALEGAAAVARVSGRGANENAAEQLRRLREALEAM